MKQPAVEAFFDRLPNTLVLIPWACCSAWRWASRWAWSRPPSRRLADRAAGTVAVLGVAMPSFWLGILLIFVFSVELGWLPSAAWAGPSTTSCR